ncbi:hypothetical protein [Frankia sp. QA3]|uniref:hypothetical protein n=1 Tax=Frankia sp. QA3 TaxID=710111 RepID=UPI000269BB8F|nr:hypothetical protein [Frankia sp. QA3]EIV91274.1 hypothetical protein FraQA3DRAFT_0709 [Frankia sp. QA3]
MTGRDSRIPAAVSLLCAVAAPLLLGHLAGGPTVVWVLLAAALALVTAVPWLRRTAAPSDRFAAPPASGTPLPHLPSAADRLPASDWLLASEPPADLPGDLVPEWQKLRWVGRVFGSTRSAVLWHLLNPSADVDRTGLTLEKLEYLVSVVAGKPREERASPWQPQPAAPSGPVLAFEDHARALVTCVLPTSGDARRSLLARELGHFLQRWNPSEEFDRRTREAYLPGSFDDWVQESGGRRVSDADPGASGSGPPRSGSVPPGPSPASAPGRWDGSGPPGEASQPDGSGSPREFGSPRESGSPREFGSPPRPRPPGSEGWRPDPGRPVDGQPAGHRTRNGWPRGGGRGLSRRGDRWSAGGEPRGGWSAGGAYPVSEEDGGVGE